MMNLSSSNEYNINDSNNDMDEDMHFSEAMINKHKSDQLLSKSINLIPSQAKNSDMSTCWATEEDFHMQQMNSNSFLPSYSPQME